MEAKHLVMGQLFLSRANKTFCRAVETNFHQILFCLPSRTWEFSVVLVRKPRKQPATALSGLLSLLGYKTEFRRG